MRAAQQARQAVALAERPRRPGHARVEHAADELRGQATERALGTEARVREHREGHLPAACKSVVVDAHTYTKQGRTIVCHNQG